jgi:hypothetical protein
MQMRNKVQQRTVKERIEIRDEEKTTATQQYVASVEFGRHSTLFPPASILTLPVYLVRKY